MAFVPKKNIPGFAADNPYSNTVFDAVQSAQTKKEASPFIPYTGQPTMADQPAAPVTRPVTQPTTQPVAQPSRTGFASREEAQEALTTAFTPQSEAQRQAIERAASLIPGQEAVMPVETPTVEPTAEEIFGGLRMGAGETDGFDAEYEAFLRSQTEPIDEEQIRTQSLSQMQAQIDAVNRMYADELARAKVEGRGRLGTATAIGARRGLLGSDFGEAQVREVEDVNRQIEQSIENERLARISALMSEAQQDATAQIRERRAAMLEGFEARKAYYAGREERKALSTQKAVRSLLSQGVTPDQLNQAQLGQFARSYGVSTDDLLTSYEEQKAGIEAQQVQQEAQARRAELENRKIEAQIAEMEADIQSGRLLEISEGTMLYDTETGETFKNPRTAAPKVSGRVGVSGVGVGTTGVAPVSSTEAIYGSPEYYNAVFRESAGGKDLTQSETENLMQVQRALGGVDNLVNQLVTGDIDRKTAKGVFGTSTGKIKGRVSKLKQQLIGDADVAQLNATIQGLVPTVARGIFGEVGVLTDADIANYKKTLPTLINTGRENEAVTLVMLDVLKKSYASALETYGLSGRDVSKFIPQYENFQQRVDGLQSLVAGDVSMPDGAEVTPAPEDEYTRLQQQGLSDVEIQEYLSLTQ